MQSQPEVQARLPVFMFPESITFVLNDQKRHKQVLTLYNPYDFPIKFKVSCNNRNKYVVVDPEGTIKAKHCIDIVIRHTALLLANCNVTDKFRIKIHEHPTKQIMGIKDVEATLVKDAPPVEGDRVTPDPDLFQQLPGNETRQQKSYALIAQDRAYDRGTNYVALMAGIVCLIGLLMPTEGDKSYRVPEYLHLPVNFKLICSFVLGMVTIIVLRL